MTKLWRLRTVELGRKSGKEGSCNKRYSKTGQDAELMREEPLANVAATS